MAWEFVFRFINKRVISIFIYVFKLLNYLILTLFILSGYINRFIDVEIMQPCIIFDPAVFLSKGFSVAS